MKSYGPPIRIMRPPYIEWVFSQLEIQGASRDLNNHIKCENHLNIYQPHSTGLDIKLLFFHWLPYWGSLLCL